MLHTLLPYLAPLRDLGLGDVLDGDRGAVLGALAGVDDAEAALAQHPAHPVGALEGLAPPLRPGPGQDGLQVRTGVARQAAHLRIGRRRRQLGETSHFPGRNVKKK